MITVPPTTDDSGSPDIDTAGPAEPAGNGHKDRVVAVVPVARGAIDPRPYVLAAQTMGPAEPIHPAGAEPGGDDFVADRAADIQAELFEAGSAAESVGDEAGRATGHWQTAGWGGEPGQCGVECACGTTFDNFGTIAEAAALLDGHIAAAATTAAGPADNDVEAEPDGPTVPGRPPVYARDARTGMLLAHDEEGENVGLEIRHVEPWEDGTGVTVLLVGGHVEYHKVGEVLDVIDRAEARAAQARLAAWRRRAQQIALLRQFADLAEQHPDLRLPYYMRIEGSVSGLDDLQRWAEELGCEATESSPGSGNWELHHGFGAERHQEPVELRFAHYEPREAR